MHAYRKDTKNPMPLPNKSSKAYNPVGADITIITDEYKLQTSAKILHLNYGIAPTRFGNALLSWCNRGICSLIFCDAEPKRQLEKLGLKWPDTTLHHNPEVATTLAAKIFQPTQKNSTLTLLLKGTEFQIKVWRALLNTRPGQTISYSQLAQMTGTPKAQRAVGSAMSANPIVYLVPCHRVIRKDGTIGNYGGGTRRKQNMLDWESKQR